MQVSNRVQGKSVPLQVRLFGVAGIVVGLASWWYNWHLRSTEGQFYIKLTLLGPLALLGGLLMLFRPEWTGPIRPDSTREHKIAVGLLIALMVICAGIDFYLLKTYRG